MKIEDATPKEFEELLDIAIRRKTALTADFNAAQREYVKASSSDTTLDYRAQLHQKADALKAELEKVQSCITGIETRLSGTVKTSTVDSDSQKILDSKARSADRLNKHAGKLLNLLKVQITPSTICVEPNDAIIKALFGNSGANISVTEKTKTKKRDAIVTNIKVQGDNPLDEHARDVLGVIVSEYDVGNHYTTTNIIHRALIGKPGQVGIVPRRDQKNAIVNSVDKLMGTVVDFTGVNESLKKLKYIGKDGNELILRKDNLVSASVLDAKVNGQPVDDVIYFKESCPLFDIANLKNQVIRYPHELLNVPNQNNTPLVITLKKYVIHRICEIKLHKQLAPTITFDDVFSKCKVDSADAKKKFDARNIIITFFEHLKAQKFITDFEVKKRGREFTGVSFTFNPQE